jgi:hypothetical protein
MAGVITPGGRLQRDTPEIPSFSESMGEMFLGRKGMEMQRRFFRGDKEEQKEDRGKRRR